MSQETFSLSAPFNTLLPWSLQKHRHRRQSSEGNRIGFVSRKDVPTGVLDAKTPQHKESLRALLLSQKSVEVNQDGLISVPKLLKYDDGKMSLNDSQHGAYCSASVAKELQTH